jgi:hypothetical protein
VVQIPSHTSGVPGCHDNLRKSIRAIATSASHHQSVYSTD